MALLPQREVDLDRLRTLGAASWRAFIPHQRWIFRRVESISFRSGAIVARRISVDFVIPRGLPATRRGSRQLFYVPLSVLAKWPPLLSFDLRVGNQPGHLLTSEANGAMDEQLLKALLRELVGPSGAACCDEAVKQLTLGVATRAETWLAYEQIETALGDLASDDQGSNVLSLVESLRGSRILWVPVVGTRGERHVAHFSFDERFRTYSDIRTRLVRTLAWGGGDEYLPVPHVGQTGSYHIDFCAPEGLRVTDANLYFVVRRPAPDQPVAEAPSIDVQVADERAHIYTPDERLGDAWLVARMMPTWRGFLAGAWLASFGIAMLLSGFWFWSRHLINDPTSSVAVLVIVPALLGVILLRPTSHPRVFARLFGVQILLFLSGAFCVFAALVAIRYAHLLEPTRAWWRDSAYGAYAVLLAITVSLYRSVRG